MAEPQHVLLNALFLDPAASGGPETYLRGLAPALAEEYPSLRITIATTRSGARALDAAGWSQRFDLHALPCEDGQRARRTLAEQLLLPVLVRRLRPDLVHSLASVAPIVTGATAVITLHDVTFMRLPTFGALTTFGMSQVVGRASRRADGLICGSAAARDEVCATLRLDPARFAVVHHGRDPAARRGARAGGDGRIVLCVGAKRPHKNQELIVRALRALPDDVVLVLAGHAEPYEQRLRELAAQLGVATRVRFEGYVSEAELQALWESAWVYAMPTLAEGFGLPLLEAMDRGVPVAASDLPVLREVAGDVPEYFDPRDPADAARAILAVAADGAERVERGRRRAAAFTWQVAARGTMDAYRQALGGSCTSA